MYFQSCVNIYAAAAKIDALDSLVNLKDLIALLDFLLRLAKLIRSVVLFCFAFFFSLIDWLAFEGDNCVLRINQRLDWLAVIAGVNVSV